MKKIFITLCATLCTVSVFAQQLSDSSNNLKKMFGTWDDTDNSVVKSSQLAGTKWQRYDLSGTLITYIFTDSICYQNQVLDTGEQIKGSAYYYLTLFNSKQHDSSKIGKLTEGHYLNFYYPDALSPKELGKAGDISYSADYNYDFDYTLETFLITDLSTDSLILDDGRKYGLLLENENYKRFHRVK